jgi:uncharacterized membrane protein YvbJ
MFCQNCGNEVDKHATGCPKCGAKVAESAAKSNDELAVSAKPESKSLVGILLAIFLGLIGLIIGVCIYPKGTIARKTFLKAWLLTYIIVLEVYIIMWLCLLTFVFMNLASFAV